MKRSSWASGSGYVPSCSIGFCVASTKNGEGRGYVWPATVTERSCIASSNADCVLGGVRLISSASTMFANNGPFMNLNCRDSSKISDPTISEGMRSGVNCTRLKLKPNAWAMVFTSSVLASPGTPTNKTWPPAKIAVVTSRMTCSWPTITWPISSRSAWCLLFKASKASLSDPYMSRV